MDTQQTIINPIPEAGPQRRRRAGQRVFRLSAKGFFITFPQCDVPKEEVRRKMIEKFPEEILQWCIIGQEHHQDGHLHLHIALMFKQKKNFTTPNCFDFLTGQHGNYATMKSPLRSIAYCKKEDNDPTIIGNLPETSSRKQVSTEVANMIQEGSTLRDVNAAAPGYLLMNFKKVIYYQWWAERERETKKKEPWSLIVAPADATQPEIFLINWLNKNIKQPRHFKQPQLVIQAPANHRKTTLVQHLEKFLRIMYIPILEDFLDEWEDSTWDLLVFDEWAYQQHDPQYMNQLLDGQTMNIKIKGGQKRKKENLPILILTNQSQMDAFGKGNSIVARETFLTRVHWIILSRPLPIETIFGTTTGTDPTTQTMLHGPNATTTIPTCPTLIPTMSLATSGDQNSNDYHSGDEEELRRRGKEELTEEFSSDEDISDTLPDFHLSPSQDDDF